MYQDYREYDLKKRRVEDIDIRTNGKIAKIHIPENTTALTTSWSRSSDPRRDRVLEYSFQPVGMAGYHSAQVKESFYKEFLKFCETHFSRTYSSRSGTKPEILANRP